MKIFDTNHPKRSCYQIFILILVFVIGSAFRAEAQSIKLFGADLVNGTINGVALGGATMALQNSSDRDPLRVGVGLGILYGIGTGIYDNTTLSKGQQFYKSGTFNDSHNSTVIVLLDTFYGAAGGAAIGSAISLIGNEPVLDGLQYGSGAGAWIGFGFGLIDSFVLAERPGQLRASSGTTTNRRAAGLVQYQPAAENMSVGFLNPSVINQTKVDSRSIKVEPTFTVQIVNMKVDF